MYEQTFLHDTLIRLYKPTPASLTLNPIKRVFFSTIKTVCYVRIEMKFVPSLVHVPPIQQISVGYAIVQCSMSIPHKDYIRGLYMRIRRQKLCIQTNEQQFELLSVKLVCFISLCSNYSMKDKTYRTALVLVCMQRHLQNGGFLIDTQRNAW